MKIKLNQIDHSRSENTSRGEVIYDDSFMELVRSMEADGQIQPIGVSPLGDEKYKLVFGFRREAAANVLNWDEIEATEVDPGADHKVLNIIENLLRESLTFYQECRAISEGFPGLSQSEIAERLHKSRTWVRVRQKALQLPGDIPMLIERGEVGPGEVQILISKSEEEVEETRQQLLADRVPSEDPKHRVRTRTRKELQRVLTLVMDADRPDWDALLLYAMGDIDDGELYSRLDYRPQLLYGDD